MDPATPTTSTPHTAMAARHTRMGRYALWQARDYFFERGMPTMIVVGLSGFVFGALPLYTILDPVKGGLVSRSLVTEHGSMAAARAALMADASLLFLGQFLGAVTFLGALFAMNGLVSNDRKHGFYKLLFAKPVTPERYYGQAFLVNSAGFAIAILLLGLLWETYVAPALSVDMLVAVLLVYLCYAGVAFFLSAAAKWDWLSLVVVAVASTELWRLYGESTHPLATLLYLLPPLMQVNPVFGAVTQRLPLPWGSLAWLAGYGVVAFLGALYVLRHRRLATP